MTSEPNSKHCPRCGETKSRLEFYHLKSGDIDYACISCRKRDVKWYTKTYTQALRELRDRHSNEFVGILQALRGDRLGMPTTEELDAWLHGL